MNMNDKEVISLLQLTTSYKSDCDYTAYGTPTLISSFHVNVTKMK